MDEEEVIDSPVTDEVTDTEEEAPDEIIEDEADEEEPADDDLISEDGKLLGKYDSAEALAKAHKEQSALMGRHARELGSLRKLAEQNGWSLSESGEVVPPAKADTGTADQVQWNTADDGTRYRVHQNPDGTAQYKDEYGGDFYTEDQWSEYYNSLVDKNTDPTTDEVDWVKVNLEFNRTQQKNLESRFRAQTITQAALTTPHLVERQRVKDEFSKEHVGWIPGADEIVKPLFEELDRRIDAAPNKAQMMAPGVYENLATVMVASQFKELMAKAREQFTGKADGKQTGSPVVLSGGRNRAEPLKQVAQVTPAVRRMAESLGVDPRRLAEMQAKRNKR